MSEIIDKSSDLQNPQYRIKACTCQTLDSPGNNSSDNNNRIRYQLEQLPKETGTSSTQCQVCWVAVLKSTSRELLLMTIEVALLLITRRSMNQKQCNRLAGNLIKMSLGRLQFSLTQTSSFIRLRHLLHMSRNLTRENPISVDQQPQQ